MRAILRWWAAHPWRGLVLAVLGCVFLVAADAGVRAVFVPAWLSLVQGLRTLWHRSRLAATLTAVLLVATGLSIVQAGGGAVNVLVSAAFYLSPMLAWAADVAIDRVRQNKGPLWLDRPADVAPAAPKSGFARYRFGCLVLVALVAAYGIYLVTEMTAPHRHANAMLAAIRPGADVREIVAAARGGFMCRVSDAEGQPISDAAIGRIHNWSGSGFEVLAGNGSSLGPPLSHEELVRLLGQRSGELSAARRLHFTFTTRAMPLRVSLTVTLDEHGRFVSASPLHAWD